MEHNKEQNIMKLSNQALGAIMMALQESLLNQLDIVMNPPTVRFTDDSEISEKDLTKLIK